MHTANYKNILVSTHHIKDSDYMSPGRLVAFAEIKKGADKRQPQDKPSLSRNKEKFNV
jgi:hypothetical protein